jgi:hypothetical protein
MGYELMINTSFFAGSNFKYSLLALTVISAMIIWLIIPPKCSAFSIKIEGIELNMDNYELCDEKQIEQLADSLFQAGAKYALMQTKKKLKDESSLPGQPSINTLLLKVEQVEKKLVNKKLTVKRINNI